MIKIAHSPIYSYQLPKGHRFPMVKYELIPQQLLREGLFEERSFFAPKKLADEEITLTHTASYWEKLKTQNLSRKEIRRIGFPIRKELIERGRYIAHGTYECALFAIESGIALNVAGGTHHAFAHCGEGFCLFNDFAIAANLLLHRNQVSQILIVDLDVHQGNGTAHIFQNQPKVFTFSLHGSNNFPLRKEKSDLDIGLPDNCDDRLYLQTLEEILPNLIEKVKPDLIFYLSGVDILEDDNLGRLKVSIQGCYQRDQFVMHLAQTHKIPIAVSMGGGYNKYLAKVINAHVNTFKAAKEIFEY